MTQTLRMMRLVETYEFSPVEMASGEPLRFRLEIFRTGDSRFIGKLYRREMYRIQPSFPGEGHDEPVVADELILVRDEFDMGGFTAESVDAVVRQFARKLAYQLGVEVDASGVET